MMALALEWFRPLVKTMAWDYCIVWQFADDPTRYIEWVGCCCNGSPPSVCRNVKEEIGATKPHVSSLCRDTYIKHTVNTSACVKLAKIPLHLPLYSGWIHGEVALSGQPSWSHDTVGTQVLIPVYGGMIEFYISKQVERDQKIIDTLNTQFNIFSQHIQQLKTEGSPNTSNPFSENSSLVSAGSTRVSPTQSIDKPTNLLGRSEQPKTHTKSRQRTSKGLCQSKNLVAERNRRHRINDGLFALRALVPNISKMNRAAIVGDAIDYIMELQAKVQELQEELERLEEDDSKSNVDELEVCKPKEHGLVSTTSDRKTEVKVEVYQIGAKDFLLKLVCGKQQGGFQRMIETINSLGLQVLDVNVTTCYDKVLNILKVEAKGKDIAAKSLKDLLSRALSDNTTRSF